MIKGKKIIEIKGVKVCLKEYPNRILVITHNGNRDEIKELLEETLGKPVIFLGELLSMTG